MNKSSTLIIVSTLVVMLLTACGSHVVSIPWSQLTFATEENPDYLGSYSIGRSNGQEEWREWGEWSSGLETLVSRPVVCFGYFDSDDEGTFYARSDYEWVEEEFDGRKCLELKKK